METYQRNNSTKNLVVKTNDIDSMEMIVQQLTEKIEQSNYENKKLIEAVNDRFTLVNDRLQLLAAVTNDNVFSIAKQNNTNELIYIHKDWNLSGTPYYVDMPIHLQKYVPEKSQVLK